MSASGQPWYVSVLNGGTVQPPYDHIPTLRLAAVDHGDIDIRSGHLRVASPHWFKNNAPLDAPTPAGQWSVTSLVDESGNACLLRVRRPHARSVQWCRATAEGKPANLRSASVLIGDADLALTLGEGAAAKYFPYMRMALLADNSLEAWEWPSGDGSRLLFPTSSVRSFYSGRAPAIPYYDRRRQRCASPDAWIGVDEDGHTAELVVDILATCSGAPYVEIDDAWSREVEAVGGRIRSETSPLQLVEESADLSQAFTLSFADEFAASLIYLGNVMLHGQIVAFDPGTRQQPVQLPVAVPAGSYPSYAYLTDYAELLLLRFSSERPVRWLEAVHQDGPAFISIDSGSYVLTGHDVWVEAETNEDVANELVELCRLDLDAVALASVPGHGAAVNCYLGGDFPAWCYLGVASSGTVSAVAVALATDPVYGSRPASMDREAIDETVRLLQSVDQEVRDDACTEVGELLANFELNGGLSRWDRSRIYQLCDRLRDGEMW